MRPPQPATLNAVCTLLHEAYPGISPTKLIKALGGLDTGDPIEPTFTRQEFAKIARVSLDTVRRRIADGTLPASRFGRQWRIPASAMRTLANGGK